MKRVSPKEMREAGWARVDPRPWNKCAAVWKHAATRWKLEHCGHPTALYPWALTDERGRLWLTGAKYANPSVRKENPKTPARLLGSAWPTLHEAITFHREHTGPKKKEGSKRIVVEARPVALPVDVAPTGGGTAQLELVRCGKPKCKRCRRRAAHGPYWYLYIWKADRQVSKYLGKDLRAGLAPLLGSEWGPAPAPSSRSSPASSPAAGRA